MKVQGFALCGGGGRGWARRETTDRKKKHEVGKIGHIYPLSGFTGKSQLLKESIKFSRFNRRITVVWYNIRQLLSDQGLLNLVWFVKRTSETSPGDSFHRRRSADGGSRRVSNGHSHVGDGRIRHGADTPFQGCRQAAVYKAYDAARCQRRPQPRARDRTRPPHQFLLLGISLAPPPPLSPSPETTTASLQQGSTRRFRWTLW